MMSKTETSIIEAGFAVFAAKPTATLADVAEAAGVGRATLHRHFKGREDLMIALAHRAMEELDAAVEAATKNATSYTEGLRLALEAMIPLAERQMFLEKEPLDNVPSIAEARKRDALELAEAVEEAKAEGGFAQDVPTPWIVQAYENLLFAAWTMVRDGEATHRQAAALAWRTLQSGVRGGTA
ncbi:TetR/AcrR family transcriptional regulator [Pelagimonas sp. KU-00592-HH]|uniref:TetR/AcrR family transcriptional regulator n=1 Tax=Pelagimonas sp. KU-00592-HH TaxID=3127651 RepID=UPI003104D556